MPWLLVVGCWNRAAGYASGMGEIVRLQPAALLLTADHQQPRHYTPYAAITQV